MGHKHRSPAAVIREWRLPGPERRAAALEAESRRYRIYHGD